MMQTNLICSVAVQPVNGPAAPDEFRVKPQGSTACEKHMNHSDNCSGSVEKDFTLYLHSRTEMSDRQRWLY